MAENIIKPLTSDGLLFLYQLIIQQFVKKETGKGLSTNDLTNDLLEKLQNAGTSSFDGNYNSLTNQPSIGGVTLTGNKTLADLGIETAIQNALGTITQISFQTIDDVASLPATGVVGTFYLVPNTGKENNNYDEYIWDATNSRYELIGTIQTEVDLSGYVQKTDIVPMTNQEIKNIVDQAIAANVTA